MTQKCFRWILRLAFYEVSRKIAVAKKLHDIGEELILPCCKDIISNVLGSSELLKLKHVSLSNDTLDETTDVANVTHLCVCLRYVFNNHLEDEFLFCETLNTKTIAREIFNKVDKSFEVHDINWEYVICVCTDGAPAMVGCCSGFQTLVKEKSPGAIDTHCTIHQQALIVKTMPDELKNVLKPR
ncbi:zinc finger BED domain-containing protein 5-like [Octopus sinensis]|uniref:Zinc finger BED domain-containing protein 5-like n=1 Tax=Octopus sinensis TaxID=2607531 RepID=A0A6P7TAF6_9MOLL|nr:zinc finger BED domain-containing protein 5-like [Octopus sinensis]